ncbi:hypothetical protein Tco_1141714 [Tanacetum coccineum]
MSSEDCSECSDSGSDLCIEESTSASLVSVTCHPVEERVRCCLEADALDSLGFFELWSSALGGGLADPEAVESDLLLFVDLPWFDPAKGPSSSSSSSSSSSLSCLLLWSLTLSATSLSMASSSVNDTPDFNSVFVIGQMKDSLQGKDNVIQKLKMQISQLKETHSELDRTLDFRALDFQISQLTEKVNVLQEQNELFRAENAKIKQHYKELYDSIKIMNNREVHLVYLKHLKESVDTLREIVEEAKVERPLDRSLAYACCYTKHSQELLEYVFGTCPKVFNQQDKKARHHVLLRVRYWNAYPVLRVDESTFTLDLCHFWEQLVSVSFWFRSESRGWDYGSPLSDVFLIVRESPVVESGGIQRPFPFLYFMQFGKLFLTWIPDRYASKVPDVRQYRLDPN